MQFFPNNSRGQYYPDMENKGITRKKTIDQYASWTKLLKYPGKYLQIRSNNIKKR